MSIQRYPIGLQDFSEVITRGCVYVDKTHFVHQLLTTHKYYFLSRPRRFGKSLLISTFDYLLRGHKELFEGLYIYDKWVFEEYPVIRITFSDIGYRTSNLTDAINKRLDEIADRYGISLNETEIDKQFRELIHQLHKKFNQQVAILIDEYDKPIIDYLDKENQHIAIENRRILKSFYSILKDADPYLKIVFITGVSKFSQVSIFSDLNNLNDISLVLAYNAICGISQEELETNFSKELELYNKAEIKEWYNGYRWNINASTVYNPFSLLNFFDSGGDFFNYWYVTGTPTFLIQKSREEGLYEIDRVTASQFWLNSFDVENIAIIPILFQTGYLTIVEKEKTFGDYVLSFPNKEVKQAYLERLSDAFLHTNTNLSKTVLDRLLKALLAKDEKELTAAINLAFSQLPYDLWQKENEKFYHAIVHLLFSLLGVYVESEVHSERGRADIIIHYHNNVYCLEFKLDKSAEEAIAQIEERGYLDKYNGSNKTLHKIGINFSSAEKKVEKISWV